MLRNLISRQSFPLSHMELSFLPDQLLPDGLLCFEYQILFLTGGDPLHARLLTRCEESHLIWLWFLRRLQCSGAYLSIVTLVSAAFHVVTSSEAAHQSALQSSFLREAMHRVLVATVKVLPVGSVTLQPTL